MLNIVDVGAHLLDPDLRPPIKALFIYNHNPVIVHPDQNRISAASPARICSPSGCDVVMTDSIATRRRAARGQPLRVPDLYAAYGRTGSSGRSR